MSELRYQIVLYQRSGDRLSLEALASSAGFHLDQVRQFLEYGLIEPIERNGELLLFDVAAVPRLRMIERIRRDIGVNLAGIAVILDLIDRLRDVQRENEILRNQL